MHNNPNWPESIAGRISGHGFPISAHNKNTFQVALDLAPYPILLASAEGLTLEWGNVAAAEFLQLNRNDFSEFIFADFVPERELPRFWQAIADLQKAIEPSVETLISAEDGIGLCPVSLVLSNEHLIAVGQSLPVEGTATEPTDALTGLLDRRALHSKVEEALLRERHNWGLLFVDLNDYKHVNDRFGHIAGDRVLVDFARKLQASSRPNDLVVRYGGDEFVVFVDRILSETELSTMAERLSREVTVTVNDEQKPIKVTCSVGHAMASHTTTTVEQLVAAADRDMYLRKRRLSE